LKLKSAMQPSPSAELIERADDVEKTLADILDNSRRHLEEKELQTEMLRQQWEADRITWQRERGYLEDKRLKDIKRLRDEVDRLREKKDPALHQSGEGLNAKSQGLTEKHGFALSSRDPSLQALFTAIGMHMQTLHTKLETHARAEMM
jgi:hypothetical protein